jgi:hypothetical protein
MSWMGIDGVLWNVVFLVQAGVGRKSLARRLERRLGGTLRRAREVGGKRCLVFWHL